MNTNDMYGTIPEAIGDMTSLSVLYERRTHARPAAHARARDRSLGFNEFSGSLPGSIFLLPAVTEIDMSGNALSGELPVWWAQGVELHSLDVSLNQLSGTIPDTVPAASHMVFLDLSVNAFRGALPASFSNMVWLETLSLADNEITGARGAAGPCGVMLTRSACRHSGTLPDWLGQFPDVSELDFSNNGLSGSLPCALGNLSSLEMLSLGGNYLDSLASCAVSGQSLSMVDLGACTLLLCCCSACAL